MSCDNNPLRPPASAPIDSPHLLERGHGPCHIVEYILSSQVLDKGQGDEEFAKTEQGKTERNDQ